MTEALLPAEHASRSTGVMRDDEAGAVSRLIDRLAERFPHISREEIGMVVTAAHALLDGAPIRAYVPLLVEHDAVDHLWSRRTP